MMNLSVRKSIFFLQLFLFSLSVPGIFALVITIVTGQKMDVDTLNIIKIIYDFIINVFILIGLYAYAFNMVVMRKIVWIIVLAAAVLNMILSIYDVLSSAELSDFFLLAIIFGWQIVVLVTLGLYMVSLRK